MYKPLLLLPIKNKMQGEMKVYTYSAFRMAAVATIRASADRLIVFLSAISLFAITSYSPSASIFPGEKFSVESMLQREKRKNPLCASVATGKLD